MTKMVSLRFVRRYENVNAGEVAGYSAEEAERIVGRGYAIYREAEDIPPAIKERLEREGEEPPAVPEPPREQPSGPEVAPPRDPSPLPDSFPAREALIAAGVDTLGAVPRTEEGLLAIQGIGVGFARRILKALATE